MAKEWLCYNLMCDLKVFHLEASWIYVQIEEGRMIDAKVVGMIRGGDGMKGGV